MLQMSIIIKNRFIVHQITNKGNLKLGGTIGGLIAGKLLQATMTFKWEVSLPNAPYIINVYH